MLHMSMDTFHRSFESGGGDSLSMQPAATRNRTLHPVSGGNVDTLPKKETSLDALYYRNAQQEIDVLEAALSKLEVLKRGRDGARVRPPDFQRSLNALRKLADRQSEEIRRGNLFFLALIDKSIERIVACGIQVDHDEKCRLDLLRADIMLLRNQVDLDVVQAIGYYANRPYLLQDQGLLGEICNRMARLSLESGSQSGARDWLLFGAWRFPMTAIDEWSGRFRSVVPTIRRILRGLDISGRPALQMVSGLSFLWCSWGDETLPRSGRIFKRTVNNLLERFAYVGMRMESGRLEALMRAAQGKAPLTPDNAGNDPLRQALTPPPMLRSRPSPVLVSRGMGGLGDLLMMTPGLHALAQQQGQPVHFAIRKRFFPLFEGNPDVVLLDADADVINVLSYDRWVNLTHCPAAREETRTLPNVTKSRIEIFARSICGKETDLSKTGYRPRYTLLPADEKFQADFWQKHQLDGHKVIGVQLFSQDTYKDYPHMRELVYRLAETHKVLIIHHLPVSGYDHPNIVPVLGMGLREAFAVAARCDAIVSPDSAFVHFAAAFNIPTVAIFGPTDGRTFTKHYPQCRVVDLYRELRCLPCWRNEDLSCKLTDGRRSICLGMIPVETVIANVESALT